MKFENLTHDELDELLMEKLIYDNEELSPILKGHLFIEGVLETLITRCLPNPDSIFKNQLSFKMKLDLAKSLNLLDDKHVSAFKAINRIRNNYAHDWNYQVSFEDLTGFKFDWEAIQVEAYEGACTKGVSEASRIATIFLCWKATLLIEQPEAQ
ncbi:MAG: hypothetical protein AAFR77_23245 [Cyanobacteria bacterium J06631_2]